MHAHEDRTEALLAKIRLLPENRLGEVEDFVDFLRQRSQDRTLVSVAARASEAAFAAVWDNPEDDAYNDL
ncbi:MAG: toxin-antitoxin system, antitoxin component, Xre family protein [Chloroflexota bacterium]